jgi:hypothetical protein
MQIHLSPNEWPNSEQPRFTVKREERWESRRASKDESKLSSVMDLQKVKREIATLLSN